MKYPQIVVFESDGLLARYLDALAAREKWLLREPRQVPACLNLLRAGGPSVLVLRVGRNLVRELAVLDDVYAALPDVPVIVVGDTADDALEVLAYDLGAAYVLQPPNPLQRLVGLVEKLMGANRERMGKLTPDEPMESDGAGADA
jgi:DNA-binding NtrC family response regulator